VVAYEQGITYPVKVMVAEREEFKHLTHWSTFCRNTGLEGFCFLNRSWGQVFTFDIFS